MQNLINKIQALKKTDVKIKIDKRIQEFKNQNKKPIDDIFIELCFCILTANFNAEKSIKIQDEIGHCFLTYNKNELSTKLKNYGHRFPNTRAEYISKSLKYKNKLKEVLQFHDKNAIREWIVNNIDGLGYKECSHFLRNIGFDEYAIIDFHIIDILSDNKIIKKPKTLTKKKYLEIEDILKKLAKETNLSLSELDLYLWYMETGKILK